MRLTLRLVHSGGELLQNKCFCDQLQSATQQREGGGDKQRVAVETGGCFRSECSGHFCRMVAVPVVFFFFSFAVRSKMHCQFAGAY